MSTHLTVGIGAARDADLMIDLGDLHPTSHGALRLRLVVEGDIIREAEGVPGLLHRGAEKLFEARDYRQIIMLADRHDWHGAFGSEVGVALAVERLAGIIVPERATMLRTLLSEVTRVQASLIFLGTSLQNQSALLLRERWLDHSETLTGNRLHPMICRIGGLATDVTAEWLSATLTLATESRSVATGLQDLVMHSRNTLAGVAVLDSGAAAALGASGPVARASGLDLDLRRDEPYLAYGAMPMRVVTRTEGDAWARFSVLAEQLDVSLDIIASCVEALANLAGPVEVRLPKVLRAPEGETYVWTENPSGINGYYLVSSGEPAPWRLKIRSAGFGNLQALAAALPGTRVAHLPIAIASFTLVAGDVDR